MKRLTSFAVVAFAVPLFVAWMAVLTQAEDLPTVSIHGFGGWAAGHTSNENVYPDSPAPIASKDWEYDNYYFTLNLVAHPADKVMIHAQPTWQSTMLGKDLRLDVAYTEVTVAKDLRLRIGKIKNPLGVYTEIYKVGTLRPFYLLPQAYYRLAPEGYAGVGVNRVQRFGSWELELDVLGGQMTFESSDVDLMVGFNPAAGKPVYASLPAVVRGRDVVGGGALLRLPVKGLEVGVSVYSLVPYVSISGGAMMRVAGDRQQAYATSAEYLTDKVSVRAETMWGRGNERFNIAYAEAAYKLTSRWQIAATYDYANFTEPPPLDPSKQLKKHRALGAALNYWFTPKLAYKLNYYRVSGNRVARPEDAVNLALAGTLQKDTDVLIAGVHFAF